MTWEKVENVKIHIYSEKEKTGLDKILEEKGFTDEQIEQIYDALGDDRVCSVCYGATNERGHCYCMRDD